ncbi:MAG TPA: hypothetical protein ACQGQH_03345 [Xylella sp.]
MTVIAIKVLKASHCVGVQLSCLWDLGAIIDCLLVRCVRRVDQLTCSAPNNADPSWYALGGDRCSASFPRSDFDLWVLGDVEGQYTHQQAQGHLLTLLWCIGLALRHVVCLHVRCVSELQNHGVFIELIKTHPLIAKSSCEHAPVVAFPCFIMLRCSLNEVDRFNHIAVLGCLGLWISTYVQILERIQFERLHRHIVEQHMLVELENIALCAEGRHKQRFLIAQGVMPDQPFYFCPVPRIVFGNSTDGPSTALSLTISDRSGVRVPTWHASCINIP